MLKIQLLWSHHMIKVDHLGCILLLNGGKKINTSCCIDSIDKVISLLPEYVGYFCDHTQE